MNWSERTVSDKLDVKGKDVDRIIKWYFAGEIWVNRRYQRKLVWSLEEKKLFIDSILNKFPTPSMMVSSYDEKGEHKYEIIDGLQRINAIISFALGEFPVLYEGKECFFDLSQSTPIANELRNGKLVQNEPILSEKLCNVFLDYEIPLILTEQSPDKVEQIFSRINSSGKKLSAHDLRQSCSCDNFADLVRRVSCYIRKEFSFEDLVNLCDMTKISISGPGLHYAINYDDTFWNRHNIISYNNVRQSRDEEVIAQILGEILLPDMITNPSYDILNRMYSIGDKYNEALNLKVKQIGIQALEERMRKIFDMIDMIFYSVGSDFSTWSFSQKSIKNKTDCFRVFFIALYRLISGGYCINDYNTFAQELKLFADNTMSQITNKTNITQEVWERVYGTIYRYIKDLMNKAVEREITEEEKEIKKRLSKSSFESQMTEYKIGLSHFSSGTVRDETIHRIAIALSAMANTNSDEDGYVIIGIANDTRTGKNWELSYGTKSLIYNGQYVTGIRDEAIRHFHDIDLYINKLRKYLSAEPMDPELKEYVLSNFKEIDFEDRKLLLIPSKKINRDVKYNGVVYVRHGNSSVVKIRQN